MERVIENPQFRRNGDVLLNTDKAALDNYKKQKGVSRKLRQIEKRLEMVEKVLLQYGITENQS